MDGQTIIYGPDGSELASVVCEANSYRRWQVMGEHAVTMNFKYAGFIVIPVGAYIEFKGHRYTLYNPSDLTKNGTRNFEYTLKLYAYQELMNDTIFINIPDSRTSFSRTARPGEFLQSLVDNLNREDGGWTVGACIDAVQKEIQFNETSCFEALRLMAEAFKTEWEVVGKVISLRKVEYFKDAPLALQYGKGNGFKPGLGRGNYDDSRPVNRLFVRGGERNIDFSTYGSQTLLLPTGQSIAYDGTWFEDQEGFNSTIARSYTVSGDGRSFVRTDTEAISKREGSVELTEIYPMREGTISGIVWIYNNVEFDTYAEAYAVAGKDNAGSIFCDVFDDTIPDALDYSQWRLDGEQMRFVLQSGRLAGREIGIQQEENSTSGYIHAERRFKLITEAENGAFIPDARLAVGDKYAVFGMRMPDAYVRDDTTRSGGSWDLFREAVRYKYENEELRFTFKGEVDGIWAQENWDEIEDKIVPGGYIDFSDTQFQPEGVLIRISAIKEYLHQPYKPQLELTNIVIGGGVRGEINKIGQQEVVIDDRVHDIAAISRRQWRDTLELRDGLAKMHLGFTEAIKPVSVQTMQMIAGSEQLQFRFVDGHTNPSEIRPEVIFDPSQNTVSVSAATIQHMTLGIEAVTGAHALDEYTFWDVDALTQSDALEEDKLYWLYARVPKIAGFINGTFVVTTDEQPFDSDPGYYNLLVGALSSEYDGERSWSPLYGFTEVLPGQIITPLIRSNDGKTFFDLLNGIIGGNIHFTATDGTDKPVADFADEAKEAKDYIDNTLPGILEAMQGEIDGQIEQFFEAYDPTNDNAPANSWSDADKEAHLGDLFYNTTSGKVFRWIKEGTTYRWQELQDSEVAEALALANDALALAKTKRRIFTVTPTTPYDVGDLWAQGTTGDMMRCTTARATGSYTATDWEKAAKYTDDTAAIAAQSDATTAKAVTDNFTQIAGGLLLTTLIKMLSNGAETGGLSANLDNILLWGGGTYAQAMQNLAKIILRHDGSGQFAGGNIKWDTNGNAELNNALFRGTVRRPWVYTTADGTIAMSDQYDNLLLSSTINEEGYIQLKWDTSQSGRTVKIMNSASSRSSLPAYIIAPSGYYFYENGQKSSSIKIFGEYVEIVGIGSNTKFDGWLVTKRTLDNLGAWRRPSGVISTGVVSLYTNNTPNVQSANFDGSQTITASRISTGRYRLSFNFPSGWNMDKYIVMLTGIGFISGSTTSPIKATLTDSASTYFEVTTSDDNTANDGEFSFLVLGAEG